MYHTNIKSYLLTNFVFDESFSSTLAYTSQPSSDNVAMRSAVLYVPYATYSKEKTCYIITFTQFEEGGLLSETLNNMESGNEYYDNSTLSPLISEEEMGLMSLVNKSDAGPMSTDIL